MNVKAIFFDLDGTLYFKGNAIKGSVETVDYLRSKGYICRFLTNTDSRKTSAILDKVTGMGFHISPDEIFTPVTASVKYLEWKKDASVYPLVSDDIISEYEKFNVREDIVDYLVIGDCREKISYSVLNKVFRLIGDNTEILALQKGRYYYDSSGKNLDTGAFVSMMEYASNKSSTVLGKPSESFFNILLQDLKLSPSDTLIIGDDITTDIVGANKINAVSALVKTGKYMDQLNLKTGSPDYVLDSVADLMNYL
jgi:HAD superfamily hydrolase (TIGR01458 family)